MNYDLFISKDNILFFKINLKINFLNKELQNENSKLVAHKNCY